MKTRRREFATLRGKKDGFRSEDHKNTSTVLPNLHQTYDQLKWDPGNFTSSFMKFPGDPGNFISSWM